MADTMRNEAAQVNVDQPTGDVVPTEEISLNLTQLVSTITDMPALLLEFDYRFLTDAGTFEVLLDDMVLVSLPAVQSEAFTQFSAVLDDPALRGLDVAELHLRLHPGSVATVQLDNLVFQPIPEPGAASLLAIGGLLLLNRRFRHSRRRHERSDPAF